MKVGELSENMEDYLETIYWIVLKHKVARVKDIAEQMEVAPASVTGAMKTLAAKDLVTRTPYGYIELTPEGERLAKEVDRRHQLLTKFLTQVLGVNDEAAAADACRMEHAVGGATIERLLLFVQFMESGNIKNDGVDLLAMFQNYCQQVAKKS